MPFAARCFQARKLGLLLPPFSLGPPLAKSQKMADLGAFAKCVHNSALRALLRPQFAPKCCPMIAL